MNDERYGGFLRASLALSPPDTLVSAIPIKTTGEKNETMPS